MEEKRYGGVGLLPGPVYYFAQAFVSKSSHWLMVTGIFTDTLAVASSPEIAWRIGYNLTSRVEE